MTHYVYHTLFVNMLSLKYYTCRGLTYECYHDDSGYYWNGNGKISWKEEGMNSMIRLNKGL